MNIFIIIWLISFGAVFGFGFTLLGLFTSDLSILAIGIGSLAIFSASLTIFQRQESIRSSEKDRKVSK